MRKLMIVIVLSVFSIGASAQQVSCEKMHEVASMIMEVRQQGVPITEIIKATSSSPSFHALIREAYKKPLYNTTTYKEEAINEFANSVYLICMESEGV